MTQTPVLITGAGPTGLVLALWLRQRNIPFRIIDRSTGPGQTSRALAIQARTLEFYQQLGLADEIVQAGITVKNIELYRRGKKIARASLGAVGQGATPFPFLIF